MTLVSRSNDVCLDIVDVTTICPYFSNGPYWHVRVVGPHFMNGILFVALQPGRKYALQNRTAVSEIL